MKLKPLYRLRFRYTAGAVFGLGPEGSAESQHYFEAEGTCTGRITGRLRGTNHPRQRSDGTFEPNFQGLIHTEDGATIFHDCRGYGRAWPAGRRQVVVSAFHLSDDPRYRWLNDSLAVGTGEVRVLEGGGVELVIDWAEVVWEPMSD